MIESIYPTETIGPAQILQPTRGVSKPGKSIRDKVKQLAETLGSFAVEIYRHNNNPEPIFSNGGTRVVFRPDRIDLA